MIGAEVGRRFGSLWAGGGCGVAPVHSRPLGNSLREMGGHFASVVLSSKKGKVLVSIWSAALLTCLLVAIRKAQGRAGKPALSEKSPVPKRASKSLLKMLAPLLTVTFPSLFSKTSLHLVAYTTLLCLRILLTIKIAKVTGTLGKTVGARTFDRMFQLQVVFGLWCMPGALVNSLSSLESSEVYSFLTQTPPLRQNSLDWLFVTGWSDMLIAW